MESCKVVAVVVTHNRPNLLRSSLYSLRLQTIRLHAIIVVDNASDFETVEFLENEKDLILLRMENNTGGSGGFAAGIKEALNLQPDWIWLIEDDVIAHNTSLEILLCKKNHKNCATENIGLLCPAVEENGRLARMHRRYFNHLTLREKPIPKKKYKYPVVEMDTASFVGALIRAEALLEVGIPDSLFFIYFDDTEFSLRLKRAEFKLFLVPESLVNHRRVSTSRLRRGPYGLRHYYNLRNRLIVYRKFGRLPVLHWLRPLVSGLILLVIVGKLRPHAIHIWLKALADSRKGPFVAKD